MKQLKLDPEELKMIETSSKEHLEKLEIYLRARKLAQPNWIAWAGAAISIIAAITAIIERHLS